MNPSEQAADLHNDPQQHDSHRRTLGQQQQWPSSEKVAGPAQNVKQHIISWRPESTNIRKWNVTSQPVRKDVRDGPTRAGATSHQPTRGRHVPPSGPSLPSNNESNQSPGTFGVDSPTDPVEGALSPSGVSHSRSQHEEGTISVSASTEVVSEGQSSSPMSLEFITKSDKPKSAEQERQDLRRIKRRAQQVATLRRKQARHSDQAGRSSEHAERSLSPSLASSTALSSLFNSSVNKTISPSPWDPFQTGKILLTPHMESVLMHYFTVILPAVEPMRPEHEEFSKWAVPLTNAKPAMTYALLSCMAYDMEQSAIVRFQSPQRSNLVAEYRIKAIQLVNECLADNENAIDPSTITAIHYLLWQEVLTVSIIVAFADRFYRFSLGTTISVLMAFKDCWSCEVVSMECNAKRLKVSWCR